jgi:hypothetical protein
MKKQDEERWEYSHRLRRGIKYPIELSAYVIVLILCLTGVLLYFLLA